MILSRAHTKCIFLGTQSIDNLLGHFMNFIRSFFVIFMTNNVKELLNK